MGAQVIVTDNLKRNYYVTLKLSDIKANFVRMYEIIAGSTELILEINLPIDYCLLSVIGYINRYLTYMWVDLWYSTSCRN